MKVIFVGASHWHTPLLGTPLRALTDAKIVGVADPDLAWARRIAEREKCRAYATPEEAIAAERPDLAFVFGRHADMAGYARLMISEGIPFVIEKPAGISLAEVSELAELAEKAGVFAAIPFVIRGSGFMAAVRELVAQEGALYASFRFNAGLPQRYRENGAEWMLERALSGGGVLTNLGVHFLDLMSEIFPGEAVTPSAATFGHLSGEGDVEDYAAVALSAGKGRGLVETGYLYPAETGTFDLHFSVRTQNHYVTAVGPGAIEITDLKGRCERRAATVTNMEEYPPFVKDVVARVREGRPPMAGLRDMERVMGLLEASYRLGGEV
jgi:predicted dehydrogenase